MRYLPPIASTALLALGTSAPGGEVVLETREHDPFGYPRPAPGQSDVALRTSFYLQLGLKPPAADDAVLPDSVSLRLQPEDGDEMAILTEGRRFAPGFSGRLFAHGQPGQAASLAVYVDSAVPLRPATRYTVRVAARSRRGAPLPENQATWSFTTQAPPRTQAVSFRADFRSPPVRWRGGFFTGFCKPSFCTSRSLLMPTYELMTQTRRQAPRAWSLQRDYWMTGMQHQPRFLSGNQPNIVRERETRRIRRMIPEPDAVRLEVEDFFGHELYGIESGRPVSTDYHPGDEVLIADGVSDARAIVQSTDDHTSEVVVSPFPTPAAGWKIDYAGPLPTREDPDAPGLFPPGGCYLRKFRPPGTPCYYWGRLDAEFDISHRRFGRRLSPNFADAPGDLSVDGRAWTTAKDPVELHEAVRTITGHILDRYGEACLSFYWSVFNEPDLGAMFWRAGWEELQRFYDYTVDAILRAFEDRGFDSRAVCVGGLELGAIFGTNLKLREFLAHCSPRAEAPGAILKNAAFADPRLNGRRSKRLEDLCRTSGGRGTPCDFISIHAYNRSEVMAAKLIRAKQIALDIDPEYYAPLAIHSHESCPDWAPPPDPAAADSYLGNGYFETWCADVARRQLTQASEDPRYAIGETILTLWPWPNENFDGANACTRAIHVDDDGDGVADRTLTIPMPILHFLGLMNAMSNDYLVLGEHRAGGHVVSGFASRSDRDVRGVLYAHAALDPQSRSERDYDVRLELAGLAWSGVRVEEYRFDRDHNSYYRLGQQLRDAPPTTQPAQSEQTASLLTDLTHGDRAARLNAAEALGRLGPRARGALGPLLELIDHPTTDQELRERARQAFGRIAWAKPAYPSAAVAPVVEQSKLRVTSSRTYRVGTDGLLPLRTALTTNGACILVITPSE